ncbi:MAG TPA: amino acid aminotransferase [Anaeromyxobacteraceae bacterium]|nr:amino acid aminotransferase [Anaeromyxobacteraceae bacterium]
MTSSIFERVEMAPRDPILGLTEAFNADPRPQKVNLGVGVYCGEDGKVPLLASVKAAEKARVDSAPARSYLPIDGLATYDRAVQDLLFGAGAAVTGEGRAVTVQTLGGTGALKVGADLLKRLHPGSSVHLSDPSWENHRGIFESAFLPVKTYPYYEAQSRGVQFAAMKAALLSLSPGEVVLLHGCCHNPTGADLNASQWREVVAACSERELVPFVDIAYQGFADGLEADALSVRLFAEAGRPFLVSSSFSKSLSLYGERVGALSIVAASKDEAARVLSQVKRLVRTNYSNPPTHGAAVVSAVLSSPELRRQWESELAGMRDRVRAMREGLLERLRARGVAQDFSFIVKQRGLFSYTGLSAAQVERLKSEFGIYAVSSGRICVAALSPRNIDHVADALTAVLRS